MATGNLTKNHLKQPTLPLKKVKMSHFVLPDQHVFLGQKSRLETLISQFQANTDKILCVKDGWKLLIYDSSRDFPTDLNYKNFKYNKHPNTYEYHYRSSSSDSTYVFFHPDLNTWLQSENRSGVFRLNMVPSSLNIRTVDGKDGDVKLDDEGPESSSDDGDDTDEDKDPSSLVGTSFQLPNLTGAVLDQTFYLPRSQSRGT
jgi:hypothetical protein